MNYTISEEQKILKEAQEIIDSAQKEYLKKHGIHWFILIPLFVLLIAILCLSTLFAVMNAKNDKILPHIAIYGIDVSNLTVDEANEKVNTILTTTLESGFLLKHGEFETTISAYDFEVNFDVASAIDIAYGIGRSGNIFSNNYAILNTHFSSKNVMPGVSYNAEALHAVLKDVEAKLPDVVTAPSHTIDGDTLVVSKGKDGVNIDITALTKSIVYDLNNLQLASNAIEIPTFAVTATPVDLNAIHEEVYKAPSDAYFTTDPFAVYPHSNGIDFAISMEEATALLNQAETDFTIPLKILYANVTTSQIGAEAFPDELASYSTNYPTRDRNRATNVELASQKVDGYVLMPGETFSFNQVVGKRTASAGFKSATVYQGGEVVDGIGGGICQVSSTLYNAVLLANLEIVERSNHGFSVSYVKPSTDATVSWGSPDFKFKNNRNYPIKILFSATRGTDTCRILGLRQEDDYEVRIESYVTGRIPYKTIYKDTTSLAPGETKVLESGSNGTRSEAYKVLLKNGQEVSRTLLSRDTYNPHNRIIARGV